MNGLRIGIGALVLAASAGLAFAQAPTRIGAYRDWSAYTYSDQRGKVCYAASQPKQQEPSGVNRDPAFFMVTNRPAENVKNEVSIIIGYPFREGSKVTADVDGRSFSMFTKDDGAWVENAAEESALISAMRAGRSMTIKGTSRRGTDTTDTYSLSGISAALDAITKECP